MEGGVATEVGHALGEGNVGPIRVSPDGRLFAYSYEAHGPKLSKKLAIVSIKGTLSKTVTIPIETSEFNWSPDGKALQYLITRKGVTNLWEQSLDGTEARQLTKFASGLIWESSWSSDHKQLLLIRGETRSDVILLNNFRR